ncbi:hypothetical protein DMENIID0001_139700 [Sergentomyia squamirostris]
MPKTVKKEKKARSSRIKRNLSNVKEILKTPYIQKLVLERLQSTNLHPQCLEDIRSMRGMNIEQAVETIARNVQEQVPNVARDYMVTTMDNIAQFVTSRGAKTNCNFELPIILKGLHQIYPLPEMQDQTPFDVRNLYQFLYFLSLGQPAPSLDEGLLMILREAYDELMQEVWTDASVKKIAELENLMKDFTSQGCEGEPDENSDVKPGQHIIQPTPDLMDPSLNLLQIPPELLITLKQEYCGKWAEWMGGQVSGRGL